MHTAREERDERGRTPRRRTGRCTAALLLALVAACARPPAERPPLVPAAVAARGGSLESFARRSELVVHYGFPGRWAWDLAWRRPDRFRVTFETTGDDQTFVSDGRRIRTFLAGRLVTEEPAGGSCFPSLARWIAVAALDPLEGPGFTWRELTPAELPDGVARGAEARCAGAPEARYRLSFDQHLRLVELSGPVEIPVLGPARLVARFADFHLREGLLLPHRIDYRRGGEPFFEETVVRWEPHPAFGPDAFKEPP